MDRAVIHRVRHFILDDGIAISFAVPHVVQFMRLAPSSPSDLRLTRVEMPWSVVKYVPVFTSSRQFTTDTIYPPLTVPAVESVVRGSVVGAPFPAWTLACDAKLVVDTPPEDVPPNTALLSTVPAFSYFTMVDIFTGNLISHNSTVYLPLCSLDPVVAIRVRDECDDWCFLECRDVVSPRTMLLKLPTRFVDVGSFGNVARLRVYVLSLVDFRGAVARGWCVMVGSLRRFRVVAAYLIEFLYVYKYFYFPAIDVSMCVLCVYRESILYKAVGEEHLSFSSVSVVARLLQLLVELGRTTVSDTMPRKVDISSGLLRDTSKEIFEDQIAASRRFGAGVPVETANARSGSNASMSVHPDVWDASRAGLSYPAGWSRSVSVSCRDGLLVADMDLTVMVSSPTSVVDLESG
ncbi:hypothetical protein B0H16DRAFT_1736339 [Mycena metata]|uniref:Uncharacterized protein n=1 Tax=Mycena metata TaxID=1033252 RepID=A0AAD7MNL0_9AGAR|nr:hypothetical protein B0H16DRAFT_1736339 [Mycena metata]